jgi:DNA primase
MAYGIPQETIERVRTQADIVQVISEYLTLKKAGGDFQALCPFHKEKTPSFKVSPSKQIFHCFGCGAGGNVFGFLMRQEGFTFPESVRFLAERVGIRIKEERIAPGQGELRERLLELHEFARRFYCQCLQKSPKAEHAREYLERRHLAGDAVKEFSLGFAPREWDAFLSAALKKGFSRELLLQAGLAKKSPEGRVYDGFRNRIMFPIWGLSGKVIAFGGRTLEENQPKYINSPESPIYHKGGILYNLNRAKKSISAEDAVIVVEGYTDAIRLALSGIENVVASSGTAFTNAQARLIKRYASKVVFVFDRDAAGKAASNRGIEVLFAEDLFVEASDELPMGMDPDEFVREHGAEAFKTLLESAKNFLDFLVEKERAAWRKESGTEEKIKTANLLATLVGKVPDPIRREEYLRLVASRLEVKPEILQQASQKGGSRDRIEEGVKHFEKRLEREEKEYMWLARMLIHRPENIEAVRDHFNIGTIRDEALREIFEAVLKCDREQVDESVLFDMVRSQQAQQMLSMLVFENAGPEAMYPIEWWIGFIRSRQQERALKELSREISEAESEGRASELQDLLRRKSQLKRELAEARKGLMEVSVDISSDSVIGG